MKVKDLLRLLEGVDPESTVLIRDNGSILPTDNFDAHKGYNVDRSVLEFFILATEEWGG